MTNARGIPVGMVSDSPTPNPKLGFPAYVSAISDSIRGVNPARLTIGIFGSWGSGKSSILAAMAVELRSNADSVLVVEFDAWRYSRSEHLVVPLLHRVVDEASKAQSFRRAGKQVLRVLVAIASSLDLGVTGPTFNGSRLIDGLRPLSSRLHESFARPFDELKNVPKHLKGRRIVVLVDDLDRCSPSSVVDLLEAINLITDIQGFIFVLAMDYDVLVDAVAEKYPYVSGHSFLEKLVQVPFRVPALDTDEGNILRDVIPNWSTAYASSLPALVIDALHETSILALNANPRQVKRLVNSYLIVARVIEIRAVEVPHDLVVAMIGLQLAWPGVFKAVQARIVGGHSEPFAELITGEEGQLKRFANSFFAGDTDKATYKALVRLTSTIESPATSQVFRAYDDESLIYSDDDLSSELSPSELRGLGLNSLRAAESVSMREASAKASRRPPRSRK